MKNRKKNITYLVFFISISTSFFLSKRIFSTNNSQHISSKENKEEEKTVALSDEQIKKFDIQTMVLSKENFLKKLTFPGQITLNENKLTHVVSFVSGVVKEVFKGLGETTKPGEILANIQSREMAETKSSYISAYNNHVLQKDLFERDEKLWKQKFKAEVQFVQTRNAYQNAKMALEEAKQKLLALGMTEEQINKLPEQQSPLNIYNIDAPIEGQIIERHLTLGELIPNDKQIFVIANLDTVWVNIDVSVELLSHVKEGQKTNILSHEGKLMSSGTVLYVSPVINDSSRTGRAIIELDNKERKLHPGDFIKAQVIESSQSLLLTIPASAIQRNEQNYIVFKKVAPGQFKPQIIHIKTEDKSDFVEVLEGLHEGDEIITQNSFLLKAELGKSEAEHAH